MKSSPDDRELRMEVEQTKPTPTKVTTRAFPGIPRHSPSAAIVSTQAHAPLGLARRTVRRAGNALRGAQWRSIAHNCAQRSILNERSHRGAGFLPGRAQNLQNSIALALCSSLRLLTPVDVIFRRAHRQLTPVDAMHPFRAARISRNEATLFYTTAARRHMQTLAGEAYNTPMPDDTVTASHPIAFPTLDDSDLAALAPLASCSEFEDGQYVFRAGDADLDLFVVDSGAIEILNPADDDGMW
jgi:hypothetical protein